jgi:hypothetical protein
MHHISFCTIQQCLGLFIYWHVKNTTLQEWQNLCFLTTCQNVVSDLQPNEMYDCSVHVSSQLLHVKCSTVNSDTVAVACPIYLANHIFMFFQYSDQLFMSPLLINIWLQPCNIFCCLAFLCLVVPSSSGAVLTHRAPSGNSTSSPIPPPSCFINPIMFSKKDYGQLHSLYKLHT